MAEALCCGTRVLVTNWGGLAAYDNFEGDAYLIPAGLDQKGLWVSSSDFQNSLKSILSRQEGDEERSIRSLRHRNWLSVEAVSKSLGDIHHLLLRPTRLNSPLLKTVVMAAREDKYFLGHRQYWPVYKSMYKNYFSSTGRSRRKVEKSYITHFFEKSSRLKWT